MATANDVLRVAAGEVGTQEKGNNDNKYGSDYGWNNVPWCVQYQWWCFKKANASKLFYGGGKTASCSQLYNYHKARGQAVSTSALKPGDLVFFDFSGKKRSTDHVGLVKYISGSYAYTYEGNTSSGATGSQDNGDGVYLRKRALKYISCAIRPAYDEAADDGKYTRDEFIRDVQCAIGVEADGIVGPKTRGALPLLKTNLNRKHAAVKCLQKYLIQLGYSCGSDGADGVYGTNTAKAVVKFQLAHKLTGDGECGINTWNALFNA